MGWSVATSEHVNPVMRISRWLVLTLVPPWSSPGRINLLRRPDTEREEERKRDGIGQVKSTESTTHEIMFCTGS